MLYFQGKDMNYYPISVCKAPQLMVIGSEEYIDLLKLIDIYRYIQKNYKLLRQYADFDIDFWTYLDLQQPVTDNNYYTDYFETYDVDCFEHPCRFDNHDVINIKVTQDTENDKSYYSLMNRNLLGEYYLKTLYNEHKSVFEYEDYWTISSNLYFNFREEYKTYHDMSLMDDVACESEITLDFHGVESERLSKSKEMD